MKKIASLVSATALLAAGAAVVPACSSANRTGPGNGNGAADATAADTGDFVFEDAGNTTKKDAFNIFEAACATASAATSTDPVVLEFVLDGSGSMDSDNKWTAAVQALNAVFDDILAKNDPNILTFCDQSQNNIPWATNLKLAGTYPLPWYGVTLSASYQGLAGAFLGTTPLPYGPFTAGTGFDVPNGRASFLQVTPTTNWTAATCTDPSKCTVGQRIIPNMTQAQLQLLLNAPGTLQAPRLNQFDFSVGQNFTLGRFRINPKLDLFNAFNSNDWTEVQTLQAGAAAFNRPSVILQARIIRIGADIKW